MRDAHTQGPLAIIGGAEDKEKRRVVLERVVELAGGAASRWVVIPTASRLRDTGARYDRVLRSLGVEDVHVLPITRREECASPEAVQIVERATGVFMTGGNQVRLSSIVGGTPLGQAIRRGNAEGAVVAGTSAGAAFLSEHMIAYGEEGATPRAGMVNLVPGLGLIDRVVVDQHFRQRDRLGRLLTALAYNPSAIGLGVDEDTAAFVVDDVIEVVGTNAVTLVDTSELTHSAIGQVRAGEPVSLVGLKLHVLAHGGRFALGTREAFAPNTSVTEAEREELAAADADVHFGHRRH